jgi:hypothetical protein
MGYTIPSGDYSLPPLQVNVGAELGKSFGAGLAAYGARRDKERKEAKDLLDTQNAMRNTIAINQAELKTKFNANLKKSGVEVGSSLFDQYQEVIKRKGQEAMEAQMNMNFGTDITDEQRAMYAGSVSSFQAYATSSLNQMGMLTADVDLLDNKDYMVVGNAKNGEQLVNRIALGAIGSVNEEVYGPGVIVDKKLTEENGSNIVSSTVKIPTNSKFFKQVADSGGRGIYDQLQAGLDSNPPKIREENGFYVFSNSIDVSNYESRGGMDLLQEKIPGIEPNKFLQEAKVLDKEAAFANLSEPVRTSGYEIDSNGNKTGYFRVGETQIVNLAASTNSKEFRDQLEGEYARVFKSGRSVSQIQDYLYGIGISAGEEFLKLEPSEQKEIFNNALTNHLFEGRFDERVELSETVNQLAVRLVKGDERSEQLLAAANDAGIVNPFRANGDPDGQGYRYGDTIYVREKLGSRDRRLDSEGNEIVSGTEGQQYFGEIVTALENENFGDGSGSLFTAITRTPGGKTFYQYKAEKGGNPAGVYEVDEDGVKVPNLNAISPEALKAIYSSAAKRK